MITTHMARPIEGISTRSRVAPPRTSLSSAASRIAIQLSPSWRSRRTAMVEMSRSRRFL